MDDLELRYVTAPHGRIAYFHKSGPRGYVLLLHGNSTSKFVFRHQYPVFSELGFGIIAPDFAGHGDSENAKCPASGYSFPGYAAAIIELLDSLSVTSVHALGWSLGGHVALELLSHDNLLESLFIFGTPPVRPSQQALVDAFNVGPDMDYAGKERLTEEEIAHYARLMTDETTGKHPQVLELIRRTDGLARKHMIENGLAGVGVDQRETLKSTQIPVAIVHGLDDPFVKTTYMKTITCPNLWPRGVCTLPDVGHAPHLEIPNKFNRLIKDFYQV